MKKHCLSTIALLVMIVLALGSEDSGTQGTNRRPRTSPSTSASKWYSGGTLHKKSALDWQIASSQDKLATCADFVTGMWQNGNLKPSIANSLSTVDDVRPYAQELVDFLDAAFKPDPNPEQNSYLFASQTVSSFAAMGMVIMGWI